jgi:1-acyl-sn-glycerol-3-phosphate acyltransferase
MPGTAFRVASSQSALLRERRFAPFFWTQFLGAFNDNLFKNALVILLAYQGLGAHGIAAPVLINVAAGLFILPFFLLSALGGDLADKFEKSTLVRRIKLGEVAIGVLALIALVRGDALWLIGVLGLLGVQAALFGPVKYALLPQVLSDEELVGGNGLVGMGTFLAILLGTLAGGLLVAHGPGGAAATGIVVVAVAVAGYLASRRIPPIPAVEPSLTIGWNPLRETWRTIAAARVNRTVFNSIVGISWFWFFGAVFLTELPSYTRLILAGNELVGTLLLATFSIGIGIGAALCERMSGRRVEIGLVPFGSIGLSLCAFDLYFAVPDAARAVESLSGVRGFLSEPYAWRVLFDIFSISLFGGFYIVPLYALVQQRSPAAWRSRIIAANNVMNALAMVMAAALGALLLGVMGLNVAEVFMVAAIMNAAVAVYVYSLVPEFLVRFLAWMLIHTLYRVDHADLDRIPDRGPALIVCNHVSYVDAIVIMGCCRRPIRFVMYYTIFALPLLRWVFKQARTIPIAPAKVDAALLERAYDEIAATLEAGDLVCVFPEGGLTPDGEIQEFKRGVERVIARTPVPVVPLALKGLWGSIFSREGGRAFLKMPRRWRSHIELVAGDPLDPALVTASGLRERVVALRGAAR